MTIFKKKLLLLLLALLAAVSLGLGLMFVPAVKSSAAEVVLDHEDYFNIDGGVFKGLSDEGKTAIGTNNFSIELPDEVTSIGENALKDSTKLISVKVPDSVTSIGEGAFSGCSSLVEAKIPSISAIPANLFQNCFMLEKLNADNTSDFNIPGSVTTIGDNAFSRCSSIKELTVPAKVSQIGTNAFFALDGAGVINYFAKNAGLSNQNSPFAREAGGYTRTKVTVNIGDSTHPVNNLPTGLFTGHKAVKEVNFKNVQLSGGVTEFGMDLFKDCTALAKVTFDQSCNIIVINQNAFSGCTSLHSVIGLEKIGLRTIGQNAFYGCRSLNTVSIGAQVGQIDQNAFSGCERLIEVQNLSSIEIKIGEVGENDGGVAQHAKYVYGAGGASRISEDDNGFVFYADMTNTTRPDIQLLGYTGSLANVTLPGTYKGNSGYSYNIYRYAFAGNTTMKELWLPAVEPSIVEIGAYAFAECTELEEIKIPKSVSAIESNAFAGCEKLETVNFNGNDNISKIDSNVFKGCTSLAAITIPKSVVNINSSAFSGCSKLAIVNFTPNSTSNGVDSYKLETMASRAFENCTTLTAIKIPESVYNIGNNCFSGCSDLQYVYLPSGKSGAVTYGSDVFSGCHANLVLISANKKQYAKDKTALEDKLSAGTKLTYIVTLELIYQDGIALDGVHTTQKLFGMAYDLEKTGNGLNWVPVSHMPRQEGEGVQQYNTSVWFKEFNDQAYTGEVDKNELERMLAVPDVEKITLYARYFAHPNLIVNDHLKYQIGTTYTIKQLLTGSIFRKSDGSVINDSEADKMLSDFSITIKSHILTDGSPDSTWSNEKAVSEAGKYVMQITLPTDGSYGEWMEQYTIEFTIDPIEQYINDLIHWKTASGKLAPEEGVATLYFFDGQSTPYITPQVKGKDKDGKDIYQDSKIEVLTSYAVYSGSEVTIELDKSKLGEYVESVDSNSYINNKATEAGTYVAQVTLKPSNNYTFTFSTTDNIRRRGLSFEKLSDGSVIVYKTWYIAISDVNQLLAADGNGQFDMPSRWNYMDGSDIPLSPSLSKLNDQASTLITFTLEFTDAQGNTINLNNGAKIAIGKYADYLNSSMPAGQYKITFYIAAADDEDGTKITGDPAGKAFNFTVRTIVLDSTCIIDTNNKLRDFSKEYNSNDVVFASTEGMIVFDRPQATRLGEWANDKYDDYYKPFAISYLVEMVSPDSKSSNGYYTQAEYLAGGAGIVKPQAIGTYVIHYIIEAPNYVVNHGDGEYSDKLEGSYTLNITYTLSPELPNFDFKGATVLNSVLAELKSTSLDDLNYFDIYTLLDYSKLDENDSLNRETYKAPDNLRNFYNKNNYDDYSEVGTHYIFIKIKAEYSDYILCSKDKRSLYYVLSFEIVAAENSEKVALSITEWEYGRFDESVNKPVWALVFGDNANYKFTLQLKSDSTVQYYYFNNSAANSALVEQHKTFDDAPAGEYILFAEDDGNPSLGYKKYKSASIDVTVKKVNIYFEKAPYLSGWMYGTLTKDTKISLDYTLGAEIDPSIADGIKIKYLKSDNTLGDLSDLANSQGYVPAGDYYLVLTRAETANVAALNYAVKFSVLQAQNYWDKAPSIPDWTYGAFDKSLIVTPEPHFGKTSTLLVDYRVANGEWVELDNLLQNGQLAVGEYQMRVRLVLSSDDQKNFTALDPVVVSFKVYAAGSTNVPSGTVTGDTAKGGDDGISNGTVVVAIIVFAVIAVAVVAAFVVLKLIANKKANAEYIKTVKSEMKRR